MHPITGRARAARLGLLAASLAGAINALPALAAEGARFDHGIGYYVAIDTNFVIASGPYAGLTNPNAGRLTLLLDHGDHFHSIGAYSLTGSAAAPVVQPTNANNRLPETYTRTGGDSDAIPLVEGSGSFAGTWASRVLPESAATHAYSHLGIASVQSLDGLSAAADVLFNSSGRRWSADFTGVTVGLRLDAASSGLKVAAGGAMDIFASSNTFALGSSSGFDFLPTFYVDGGAAPGTYSAQFSLVNLGSNAQVRNGGTYHVDFSVPSPVPEPGTWALMLAGLAVGLARVRRGTTADVRAAA